MTVKKNNKINKLINFMKKSYDLNAASSLLFFPSGIHNKLHLSYYWPGKSENLHRTPVTKSMLFIILLIAAEVNSIESRHQMWYDLWYNTICFKYCFSLRSYWTIWILVIAINNLFISDHSCSVRRRLTHYAQRLNQQSQQSQCDSFNEGSGQLPPTWSHFALNSW